MNPPYYLHPNAQSTVSTVSTGSAVKPVSGVTSSQSSALNHNAGALVELRTILGLSVETFGLVHAHLNGYMARMWYKTMVSWIVDDNAKLQKIVDQLVTWNIVSTHQVEQLSDAHWERLTALLPVLEQSLGL